LSKTIEPAASEWDAVHGRTEEPDVPTVRQLEYLVAIADVRHFRKAAERVNTTQPTLSGQLKALEERLGVELVERSRSRVGLTPVGQEIVEVARRVLRDVREIRALGASHNRKLAGVVRLGLPASIGSSLVPRLVPDLRKEYPDLKFYVREDEPLALPNGLADGTYDLIIGPLPLTVGEFETIELYTEPLVLVVASNHPLAKASTVRDEDVSGLGILTLAPTHPLHAMVQTYCASVGARILHDYIGTSLDTLREMVGTGLGATLLPSLYVRTHGLAKDKTLSVIELNGTAPSRRVGMAWRRSGAKPGRYGELAAFMRDSAARAIGSVG
jgi:LysR family hydrogen peroxide-inducible transcriptional activator